MCCFHLFVDPFTTEMYFNKNFTSEASIGPMRLVSKKGLQEDKSELEKTKLDMTVRDKI